MCVYVPPAPPATPPPATPPPATPPPATPPATPPPAPLSAPPSSPPFLFANNIHIALLLNYTNTIMGLW